jgi:hypothetical protein
MARRTQQGNAPELLTPTRYLLEKSFVDAGPTEVESVGLI